jgi:HSP20 family molecular chaperone IbpA
MDDYDRAARQAMRHAENQIRTFSPKFDVKETKDTYELHGEFPGIEQKDINIEWTDGNTLTISGRTESHHEEGRRPQGFIEEGDADNKKKLQPSVEDENEGGKTAVAKKGKQEVAKNQEPETKFWVSERSVGEFHRSFSFPSLIDQDKVKASLKNGILSIVVPKAQQAKTKKVNIE